MRERDRTTRCVQTADERVECACEIRQVVFRTDDPAFFLGELRLIAEAFKTAIVSFDANKMAGGAHVQSAIIHALRSCASGTSIANSFEMEALLYAAGTRQCALAAGFGVHAGENRAYLVFCPPSPAAAEAMGRLVTFVNEDWESISEEKEDLLIDIFSITPQELLVTGRDRLKDLVLERVALLEVMK